MKDTDKKVNEVSHSQAGVIGNGAKIDGGVHIHNHHYSSSETASAEPKKSIQKSNQPQANILHLSDLHFGTAADAKKWYSQLADDLTLELKCSTLDALILSGDIANLSEPGEYDAAKDFIDRLCKGFKLEPDRLVIVPGNHDLNWKLAKKGYSLIDRDEYEGELVKGKFIEVADDVVRIRDEKKYKLRFEHFSRFYESVKGRPYPAGYASQGIFTHIPDLNLLIAGFNSAWELDHYFKTRASICPDAVTQALDILREQEKFRTCLKFAVWHHPLAELGDQEFMQRLAQCGFSVCFHGHIHKADTGLYMYDQNIDGRNINLVGAGTFGAPVKEWAPGYPLQYNLIQTSESIA
ncbi:metallophosphoesterase [Desulfobacterales bacterium HSG17]|nr:metallophosphoesterase [Desulfobacterales bacterium HSG17]